jgi:3-oxoacyl-[acyl-carrier-protein] synthase-1
LNAADDKPFSLAVTGVGLVTPVDPDAAASVLALNAGLPGLAELDEFPPQAYWDADAVGVEAVGGSAREVAGGHLGTERLVRLAAPALTQALEQAGLSPAGAPLPLWQTLPSSARPGRDDRLETLFPGRLERRCGIPPRRLNCKLILDKGHASGIALLTQAAQALKTGAAAQALIGSVDSLVEPPTLLWLEERGRLKASARIDGLMPGEAAGYLVLEKPEQASRRGKQPMALVSNWALTEEPATIWSKRPCTGQGLAEAIGKTIAPLGPRAAEIGLVVCDLNGERYRAVEWSYADIKTLAPLGQEPRLWHPADCIGDTGCASGLVSLVCAILALQLALAGTKRALVWSSADEGARGSVLVTAANAP